MKTTPARRGAGMIAAGALVAGALAALPMSAAHAAPTATDYTCVYQGSHAASLNLDVDAPATLHQGEPLQLAAADAEFAWGASWTDAGREYFMKYKDATATAPVLVNGTALATPAKITFDNADLAVPATGNMTWPAKVTFPPIPTTSGADVTVTLGKVDFDMKVAIIFIGGGNTFVDAEVPCAVSGTAPTIASVDVLPPGTLAPAAALKASGKAVVGQRLVASGGQTNPTSSLAYHWLVNGKVASGSSAYVVKPADLGKTISLRATATRVGYHTRVSTVSVGKVTAGSFAVSGKVKITGKAKVGKKLVAKPGKAAGTKVSYQWLRNGKAIKGAKAKTLKLKKAYKGKKISVKVTYSKAGYKSVTQTSKAVKVKK